MHVLLIGGTRFLGPLVALRLLARGHHVTTLSRGEQPEPFGAFAHRILRIRADRRTPDFERALGGRSFDAVIDFVAFEEQDVARAHAALEHRIGHYVMISTGQVYLVRDPRPIPAVESDYAGPTQPRPERADDIAGWEYGMGKRACEDWLIRAWEQTSFPSTRVRIPVVHGERDYYRRIEGYLFRLMDGHPILVPDGGGARIRHVYADAVARTLVHLVEERKGLGDAYNVSQREDVTLREILHLLSRCLGVRPELVDVPWETLEEQGLSPRAVSPLTSRWMSVLDPSRAEAELGLVHERVEGYLEKMVSSFLAHPPADPPEGYKDRGAEVALARTLTGTPEAR